MAPYNILKLYPKHCFLVLNFLSSSLRAKFQHFYDVHSKPHPSLIFHVTGLKYALSIKTTLRIIYIRYSSKQLLLNVYSYHISKS